jgi:hypothetical protein
VVGLRMRREERERRAPEIEPAGRAG